MVLSVGPLLGEVISVLSADATYTFMSSSMEDGPINTGESSFFFKIETSNSAVME